MASDKNKFVFVLAAVGISAYFLMPKKASAATTTPTTKKIPPSGPPKNGETPKTEEPKLPSADEDDKSKLPSVDEEVDTEDYGELPKPPQEESPKLPDLDEEPPVEEDIEQLPKTEDAQGPVKFIPVMDDYYQKWLKTGNEVPGSPDPHKLWISESCQSWGVGKNWAPYLMAKYLIPEDLLTLHKVNPDEMMLPTDYWDTIGGASTPDPVFTYNLYGDVPRYQIARNILALYAPQCWDLIPKRKNYGDTGFKQYHEALVSFSKTNFGQLFKFLSDDIAEKMYDHWSEQYPVQADQEYKKGWAVWALKTYPKYSTTEQTNQAYKQYFKNDPDAPKKINPKLAAHKPYQKTWVDLNQYVKQYKILMSQWG